MDDQELLRYSRHILLDDIGIEGVDVLINSHVLIIGAGGLGSACAPYLAASGVGAITLIDDDEVDLTNLQRQITYSSENIGQHKVDAAKTFLEKLNPLIKVTAFAQRADEAFLMERIAEIDVVIDCTDNFKTRQLINKVCVTTRKPLVFGAALQFDGQFSVFDSRLEHSPCYACLFSPEESFEEVKCSQMGVFSPLVGIIGSIQAANALQLLIGFGNSMVGKLGMWDAKRSDFSHIKISRNPSCSVCHPTKN
ncbi:HesA/MoeB/ThiF family protein [Polynucleobacter kasalickyi]|uniref:[sulfur carrier protein ThiS] adenylyltransferase n=1 Tax=Polynucleobacter kasalickyi TaxID=1938817 RepID=A0A1W2ASD0_9BURK|nr:HesA/MoeB/ThiF family protein [Polynucleobacter kasalickyi]SMC63422.1 [sulfur carrier protein ThiS] adenylyltransferase [Polynucleobacter kasalickyi]